MGLSQPDHVISRVPLVPSTKLTCRHSLDIDEGQGLWPPCCEEGRAGLVLAAFASLAKRTTNPLLCISWLLVHMPAACPTSRCPAWSWHMTGGEPAGLSTELEFQQQGQG